MDIPKRAKEIAKTHSLAIIESEIEDWEKGTIEVTKEINKLIKHRDIIAEKSFLWRSAKHYKEKDADS